MEQGSENDLELPLFQLKLVPAGSILLMSSSGCSSLLLSGPSAPGMLPNTGWGVPFCAPGEALQQNLPDDALGCSSWKLSLSQQIAMKMGFQPHSESRGVLSSSFAAASPKHLLVGRSWKPAVNGSAHAESREAPSMKSLLGET